MTCAAQLLRIEKGDCEIIFANALYLSGTLTSLIKRDSIPLCLYITDLPASENSFELAKSLVSQGTKVLWVDHHNWPTNLESQMKSVGIEVIYNFSLGTPAGVLLGKHLSINDEYCYQIGKICYASKNGTPWERKWFMRLSGAIGKSSPDILERLAYNQPMTSEDEEVVNDFLQREVVAQKLLAQIPRIETTQQQRLMAVYETSDIPNIYLGKQVFKHHKVQLCLHRIHFNKWQLATATGNKIDMTDLINYIKSVAPEINIGGRPFQLLSIKANASSNNWPKEIHEYIVDLIKEKL
jgi:hypothetical protein